MTLEEMLFHRALIEANHPIGAKDGRYCVEKSASWLEQYLASQEHALHRVRARFDNYTQRKQQESKRGRGRPPKLSTAESQPQS